METQEEFIKRHREMGTSEQEIQFMLTDNQKDWEPLLKDPATPANVIKDIADRITLLPLKVLVLKHPNVPSEAQKYIISKTNNKDYQQELIEAFLSNGKNLDAKTWNTMRDYYNIGGRFNLCIFALLRAQSPVFTAQKLDVILNTLGELMGGIRKEKDLSTYIELILDHKNFDPESIGGKLFFFRIDVLTYRFAVNKSRHKDEILMKLYELTKNDIWLPDEARELFVFES